MNYKLIANQLCDLLKNDITTNEIDRIANSVFNFDIDHCQTENTNLTQSTSIQIYDWILSLANQRISDDEKNSLLKIFLSLIVPQNKIDKVQEILSHADVNISLDDVDLVKEFYSRNFHFEIYRHSFDLFKKENYPHAVFEAMKVYEKLVKEKTKSNKDGQELMMSVWDGENGILKLKDCQTESEINFHEGIKFLSAGLIRLVRNPIAHEPAIDWPISKEECFVLLSIISFLLKFLDKAIVLSQNNDFKNPISDQIEIISEATIKFCECFLDKQSKTYNQMIQDAKSAKIAKQNIETYYKALGSHKNKGLKYIVRVRKILEKLLLDYENFLRQRNLPQWDKNDSRVMTIRKIGKDRNKSYRSYKIYIENSSEEKAANAIICIINQTNYLLDQLKNNNKNL